MAPEWLVHNLDLLKCIFILFSHNKFLKYAGFKIRLRVGKTILPNFKRAPRHCMLKNSQLFRTPRQMVEAPKANCLRCFKLFWTLIWIVNIKGDKFNKLKKIEKRSHNRVYDSWKWFISIEYIYMCYWCDNLIV